MKDFWAENAEPSLREVQSLFVWMWLLSTSLFSLYVCNQCFRQQLATGNQAQQEAKLLQCKKGARGPWRL